MLKNTLLLFAALASAKFIKDTPIREINSLDEFESFVLSSKHPTVVQFVENNCQYTKFSMPMFVEETKKIAGFSHAAQVNCDTNNDTKQICKLYNIKFSPQVKLFQGAEGVFKSFRLQYKHHDLMAALTELLDDATSSSVELITDITKFVPKTEDPDTNKIILLPTAGKQNEIPNLFKSLSLEFQALNNKFYYCKPELVKDLLKTLNINTQSMLSSTGSIKHNSVLVTKGNRGPFLFKGNQLKRGSVVSFLSKYLTSVNPFSLTNKIEKPIQHQNQQVIGKAQIVQNDENQKKDGYAPSPNNSGFHRIETKEELKNFCLVENSKPCVMSSIAARFMLENMKVLFKVQQTLKPELRDALNFVYINDVNDEPEEIADLLDFLPYPSSPVAKILPSEPKKWYHAMTVTYMNGPEKWKVNLKGEYATVESITKLIEQSYDNKNVDKRTTITKKLY